MHPRSYDKFLALDKKNGLLYGVGYLLAQTGGDEAKHHSPPSKVFDDTRLLSKPIPNSKEDKKLSSRRSRQSRGFENDAGLIKPSSPGLDVPKTVVQAENLAQGKQQTATKPETNRPSTFSEIQAVACTPAIPISSASVGTSTYDTTYERLNFVVPITSTFIIPQAESDVVSESTLTHQPTRKSSVSLSNVAALQADILGLQSDVKKSSTEIELPASNLGEHLVKLHQDVLPAPVATFDKITQTPEPSTFVALDKNTQTLGSSPVITFDRTTQTSELSSPIHAPQCLPLPSIFVRSSNEPVVIAQSGTKNVPSRGSAIGQAMSAKNSDLSNNTVDLSRLQDDSSRSTNIKTLAPNMPELSAIASRPLSPTAKIFVPSSSGGAESAATETQVTVPRACAISKDPFEPQRDPNLATQLSQLKFLPGFPPGQILPEHERAASQPSQSSHVKSSTIPSAKQKLASSKWASTRTPHPDEAKSLNSISVPLLPSKSSMEVTKPSEDLAKPSIPVPSTRSQESQGLLNSEWTETAASPKRSKTASITKTADNILDTLPNLAASRWANPIAQGKGKKARPTQSDVAHVLSNPAKALSTSKLVKVAANEPLNTNALPQQPLSLVSEDFSKGLDGLQSVEGAKTDAASKDKALKRPVNLDSSSFVAPLSNAAASSLSHANQTVQAGKDAGSANSTIAAIEKRAIGNKLKAGSTRSGTVPLDLQAIVKKEQEQMGQDPTLSKLQGIEPEVKTRVETTPRRKSSSLEQKSSRHKHDGRGGGESATSPGLLMIQRMEKEKAERMAALLKPESVKQESSERVTKIAGSGMPPMASSRVEFAKDRRGARTPPVHLGLLNIQRIEREKAEQAARKIMNEPSNIEDKQRVELQQSRILPFPQIQPASNKQSSSGANTPIEPTKAQLLSTKERELAQGNMQQPASLPKQSAKERAKVTTGQMPLGLFNILEKEREEAERLKQRPSPQK